MNANICENQQFLIFELSKILFPVISTLCKTWYSNEKIVCQVDEILSATKQPETLGFNSNILQQLEMKGWLFENIVTADEIRFSYRNVKSKPVSYTHLDVYKRQVQRVNPEVLEI